MSPSHSKSLEARLVDVEMQLAHQQRITEQLNEVVTEQDRQLVDLRNRLGRLNDQLERLRNRPDESPIDPLEEKPPHY